MELEPRVILNDLASLKFCNKGGREFFALHNLDWDDFRKNGIPISVLENTGDAMAKAVCAKARQRLGLEIK